MVPTRKINETLKRLRRERGLTQIAFAKQVKLTQSAICQSEMGIITPTIATLRRVAKALGVSVAELLR
jgi:transcriptional regulator with XRE-family HTH domain